MGSLLRGCGDTQQPHYETNCHPVGNNRGFCVFKSHFQSNARTRSGFLCTMDWIFCHYKDLISRIGPGVGMFYVEKGVGRGAVGEAAGRLGRAEADRRASVCMHTCGCLCVCAHMWVLVCAGVCGLIHGMECECSLSHTQSFRDLPHRNPKHKQIKQTGQAKNKGGGSIAPQPGSP